MGRGMCVHFQLHDPSALPASSSTTEYEFQRTASLLDIARVLRLWLDGREDLDGTGTGAGDTAGVVCSRVGHSSTDGESEHER